MSKIDRKAVLAKTGGRCAYCGCELIKFQVDHVIPQANFQWHILNNFRIPDFLKHLRLEDVNHPDNLFAACPSCNNYKRTLNLESFRKEVEAQPNRIKENNCMVRLAERFGLVELKQKPVVFYFETL